MRESFGRSTSGHKAVAVDSGRAEQKHKESALARTMGKVGYHGTAGRPLRVPVADVPALARTKNAARLKC